ncbi:hypothetical protein RJT34_31062 [Clitoria ternatea]|uniref:DEAD/DEAH-box helicase domain-containing protein n=1 Tax=Clitoria ternatea TaxID=43366 RepID=A0AAN9I812_CLITE
MHVSFLELRAVVDGVGLELRGLLENGLVPFRVLLEEDDRPIWVEGRDVPKPIKTFHDFGFPGWPMALKGRDLIGIAEIGLGKTLAYLLPAIVHVNAQPILGKKISK